MWLLNLLFGGKENQAHVPMGFDFERDLALTCAKAEQSILEMDAHRRNDEGEIDSFLRDGHARLLARLNEELLEQRLGAKASALRNFDRGKELLIELAKRNFGEYRTRFAISRCKLN
jgi:hypothetical protein